MKTIKNPGQTEKIEGIINRLTAQLAFLEAAAKQTIHLAPLFSQNSLPANNNSVLSRSFNFGNKEKALRLRRALAAYRQKLATLRAPRLIPAYA